MTQSTMQVVQNRVSFINYQIGVLQARIQTDGWVSPKHKLLMAKCEADRELYKQALRSMDR